MTPLTKEKILRFCLALMDDKIAELKAEIAKVEESAANETKSSMGDKYETGREIMMQEKVKLNEQLQQALAHKTMLDLIDNSAHEVIKRGSLVTTNQGIFLIASAIGMVEINENRVFVISQAAPLAKEMIGKEKGDVIHFNGRRQEIVGVG